MEDIEQTAVFVKDSDGVMVYANDAFARLLRRGGAAELVGRRTEDFFPAEAAAMLDREDSSVVEKGVPFSVERKLKCSDGQSRVFTFRKFPFTADDATFLFCFAEVAQPKAAAADGVPFSAEARARFFSAISHDVRTPLNAIVGYSQLLRNAQGPDQSREAAHAIEDGARNLMTAIDSVMTILTPESSMKMPTIETFNVSEATLQVVESYASAAGANNVELQIKSGEKHYDLVEVMACPGGCISGAGQPYISHRHRAKRGEGLYRTDRISTIKRSQDNPLMDELYATVLKGKEHELLHVSYIK